MAATGKEAVTLKQLKSAFSAWGGSSVDTFATVTVMRGFNLWYEGESGFVKTTNNQEQTIKVKLGTILTVTYEPISAVSGGIYCVGDVVPILTNWTGAHSHDAISSDLMLICRRLFLILGDCEINWTSEK